MVRKAVAQGPKLEKQTAPLGGSRCTSASLFLLSQGEEMVWLTAGQEEKQKKREWIQQKLQPPTFKTPGPSSDSSSANFSQLRFLPTFPIALYHLLLRSHSAAVLSFPFMGLLTHLGHNQKWIWIHVCLQHRKGLLQLLRSHRNKPPTLLVLKYYSVYCKKS